MILKIASTLSILNYGDTQFYPKSHRKDGEKKTKKKNTKKKHCFCFIALGFYLYN